MEKKSNVVGMTSYKKSLIEEYDDLCAEAYAWILQVQKTNGWYSESLRLTFEKGVFLRKTDCIIALFVDKQSGKAILCRRWPSDHAIKFNRVVNPGETRLKAPECYKQMVEAGLELYRREGRGYGNYYRIKQKEKQKQSENNHLSKE